MESAVEAVKGGETSEGTIVERHLVDDNGSEVVSPRVLCVSWFTSLRVRGSSSLRLIPRHGARMVSPFLDVMSN
jgi:hypothetical protein